MASQFQNEMNFALKWYEIHNKHDVTDKSVLSI